MAKIVLEAFFSFFAESERANLSRDEVSNMFLQIICGVPGNPTDCSYVFIQCYHLGEKEIIGVSVMRVGPIMTGHI